MKPCQGVGRYRGKMSSWSVTQSTGGLPQFFAACVLNEIWNGVERRYVSLPEPQTINAYLCLLKRDGSLIQNTIDNLKKALGWNGTSIKSLADGDYSKTDLQFVVNENEYENKKTLQVAFINSDGYQPQTIAPEVFATLEDKFAAALAGKPIANENTMPF